MDEELGIKFDCFAAKAELSCFNIWAWLLQGFYVRKGPDKVRFLQ